MNNLTIFYTLKMQKEQIAMLSNNKVIEIFYMADDFYIFFLTSSLFPKKLHPIIFRLPCGAS